MLQAYEVLGVIDIVLLEYRYFKAPSTAYDAFICSLERTVAKKECTFQTLCSRVSNTVSSCYS